MLILVSLLNKIPEKYEARKCSRFILIFYSCVFLANSFILRAVNPIKKYLFILSFQRFYILVMAIFTY